MLGIVGTGLIGASAGMRARRNGTHVLGYDVDAEHLRIARERGAIDEAVGREELYARSRHIVLALPLQAACDELCSLAGTPARWELLIDVASVKRPIMKAAAGVEAFAGSHPLAGNEGSGPAAADADLFEGRTWTYVPTGRTELDASVRALIEDLGAQPLALDALEHDRALAVTSHLPQIVAWLLGERIRALGPDCERLCGPAGRELLRLARSPAGLWRDVLRANADAIAVPARAVAEGLVSAFRDVDGGNGP